MIPINLSKIHWSLCVLNFRYNTIIYLDSLESARTKNSISVSKPMINLFDKFIEEKIKKFQNFQTINHLNESVLSEEMVNLQIENKKDKINFKCCDLIPVEVSEKSNNKKWKVFIADAPFQNNHYDCGVFLCKYIDYISRNISFDFTNEDMIYFRMLIAMEIFKGKLLTS